MSDLAFTRRAALIGAASLLLVPAAAAAASYDRFRSIKLDLAPLRRTGDTVSAGVMAETMPGFVQQYFAPYLAPGDRSAPTLVVRVKSVSYGVGGSAGPDRVNGAMDYIDGEGVVIGLGGKTIASYPITCALYTNVDDHEPSGNYQRHRISSLGQAVAQFLPGKMGI